MGQIRFFYCKQVGGNPLQARRGGCFCLAVAIGALVAAVGELVVGVAAAQQVARPVGHVPELSRYLAEVQIAAPVVYRGLEVYPVLLMSGGELPGQWLTLDQAMSKGVLVVRELGGGGSVPVVTVQNTSRSHHVLLMTGELLAGGKQTRTVRHDVIVAPGQQVKLDVFCVEARRWQGDEEFAPAYKLAPPSVQMAIRGGAMQAEVWDRVDEQNRALGADNPTKSLHLALETPRVKDQLETARRHIVPRMPRDAVGFLFVHWGRARACELFGSPELAQSLLPKLVEAYTVDCIVYDKAHPDRPPRSDRVAIEFFERVLRAGSSRATTPGSGAGIRTQGLGLLGEGVSLAEHVVHYGVQPQ